VNVAIGSLWRNSETRVGRYFGQVASLRDRLAAQGDCLRVVAVEGDSTDATRRLLTDWAHSTGIALHLATLNHGGPEFGSVEDGARMRALSKVANALLDEVISDDDVFVYVESDLLWSSDVIMRLIDRLAPGRDVIAPLPMAGAHFYDIWAFRVNGSRFSPFPPFYPGLRLDELTPVDSVGSCLVMRAEVARTVRMQDGALVQFCANARQAGFGIFCDGRERIDHP
jgi:hypothetical protein